MFQDGPKKSLINKAKILEILNLSPRKADIVLAFLASPLTCETFEEIGGLSIADKKLYRPFVNQYKGKCHIQGKIRYVFEKDEKEEYGMWIPVPVDGKREEGSQVGGNSQKMNSKGESLGEMDSSRSVSGMSDRGEGAWVKSFAEIARVSSNQSRRGSMVSGKSMRASTVSGKSMQGSVTSGTGRVPSNVRKDSVTNEEGRNKKNEIMDELRIECDSVLSSMRKGPKGKDRTLNRPDRDEYESQVSQNGKRKHERKDREYELQISQNEKRMNGKDNIDEFFSVRSEAYDVRSVCDSKLSEMRRRTRKERVDDVESVCDSLLLEMRQNMYRGEQNDERACHMKEETQKEKVACTRNKRMKEGEAGIVVCTRDQRMKEGIAGIERKIERLDSERNRRGCAKFEEEIECGKERKISKKKTTYVVERERDDKNNKSELEKTKKSHKYLTKSSKYVSSSESESEIGAGDSVSTLTSKQSHRITDPMAKLLDEERQRLRAEVEENRRMWKREKKEQMGNLVKENDRMREQLMRMERERDDRLDEYEKQLSQERAKWQKEFMESENRTQIGQQQIGKQRFESESERKQREKQGYESENEYSENDSDGYEEEGGRKWRQRNVNNNRHHTNLMMSYDKEMSRNREEGMGRGYGREERERMRMRERETAQERMMRELAKGLPKLDKYNGKTKWISFENQFKKHRFIRQWSDEVAIAMLGLALQDAALDHYEGLTYNSLDDLCRKMGERFRGYTNSEIKMEEFYNLKQNKMESIEAWGDRVINTAREACEGYDEQQLSKQVMRQFLSGCSDRDAVCALTGKEMEDVGEAIKFMKLYNYRKNGCMRVRKNEVDKSEEDKVVKLLEEITMKVNQASVTNKKESECYNCMQKGHEVKDCPNERVCYKCRKPGHMRKDCVKERECFVCHKTGHLMKDCEKLKCNNCGEKHLIKDCPKLVKNQGNGKGGS